MIINAILFVALAVQTFAAMRLMNQRDDLAAAWVQAHPEDFPSLNQD